MPVTELRTIVDGFWDISLRLTKLEHAQLATDIQRQVVRLKTAAGIS